MKNNITQLKAAPNNPPINLDEVRLVLSELAQNSNFCSHTTEVLYQTISIIEQFEELIFDEVEA